MFLAVLAALAQRSAFAETPSALRNPGFEEAIHPAWQAPWGGGLEGGAGAGELASTGALSFVRSGQASARLEVWSTSGTNSMAWSCVSQLVPCESFSHMDAGVWLYGSSTVMPHLATSTLAQLRLEYFADEMGREIIPTHAMISESFSPTHGFAADTWHLLHVSDRVPRGARSVRLSVLLIAGGARSDKEAVWVDDAYLNIGPALGQRRSTRPALPTPP